MFPALIGRRNEGAVYSEFCVSVRERVIETCSGAEKYNLVTYVSTLNSDSVLMVSAVRRAILNQKLAHLHCNERAEGRTVVTELHAGPVH